jgi:hypothetical protein
MEIILIFSLIFQLILIVFVVVFLLWDYFDRKRDDKYLITDVYELLSILPPRKEGESDVEWRDRIVKCWK